VFQTKINERPAFENDSSCYVEINHYGITSGTDGLEVSMPQSEVIPQVTGPRVLIIFDEE